MRRRADTDALLAEYKVLVEEGDWRPNVTLAGRHNLPTHIVTCMLLRARRRGEIPPAGPQVPRPREALQARFNKNTRADEDGCIVWTGNSRQGYGSISVGGRGRVATHVAWFLAYGEWPSGLMCHHCDNPPCVNVEHLFDGNHKANTHDMWEKGRAVPPPISLGEANQAARLTADQVQDIRARLARGETQRSIAESYDVSPSTVSLIKRGRKWAWLPLAG